MKNFSLYRIVVIVSMAVKFLLQIALFRRKHRRNWTNQTNEQWESLLKEQAIEYRQTALRLEGLLIKLGQFLSTRADIMPRVFIEQLEDLNDRVPSVPWKSAKEVLEKEWNKPYDTVIQKISKEPVASASIGQVYKVILPNGDTAALKIQRPGIERIINTDFKALRIVMWILKTFTPIGEQADLWALYRELDITIGQELDFLKELQNGIYFKNRYQSFDYVDAPFYYDKLSTRKVLVMEWVEGARITNLDHLQANDIDRRELAVRLVEVFLEQLLREGKFHADPHPGNILVKRDGTIMLIDFGMIGEISRSDAIFIRQLVEGIILEDYDQVIHALENLRFLLPGANRELLKKMIRTLVNTYTSRDFSLSDEYLVKQLFADIEKIVREQPIQLPSEFAIFGKAASTFVGTLYILDPDIDLLQVSKPLLFQWLKENYEPKDFLSPRTAFNWLIQSVRPLSAVPRRVQQALDEPRKYREWKQHHENLQLEQALLLSKKRDALVFIVISFIFTVLGILFHHEWLLYSSGTVLLFSFFYYLFSLRANRKLLKKRR
ncbi:ABC1 kinase family protein [Bacillus thermotolerans]|uniref:ABC1 kinase family protein n=1 Tax=Bacillus thermotolerans TaxID=1221996 RepID=UPI00057FE162|nr:AarF/UbiB family protein [Bacillus thermotolerans]KKB36454.1 Ubiquinone biosynthesis monooxygenase UbiB [Bacillus thermotolerans]